ncbi:hypothetical protein BDP27DRAFT_1323905 [Rhodocollybia butyracea]|uniref:Uncharacterized protein n=1 Tax=Rhodocollybia butyracea TaxID=206335 RepID=A0A9P5PUS7_9AGAR|nr:hypothetical protein BDP27DRAFT_1323905 [Rhodocollybia butyracea]
MHDVLNSCALALLHVACVDSSACIANLFLVMTARTCLLLDFIVVLNFIVVLIGSLASRSPIFQI